MFGKKNENVFHNEFPGAHSGILVQLEQARPRQSRSSQKLHPIWEKPLHYCIDPVKQSSYDEMRAFSDATGVPFQFSTSIDDLAVKAGRVKGKLFIDLTGQMDIQKKVMDKLEGLKKIIVFPAGARDDKISYYIKTFQHCNVAGLIFSKLDEEERFGNFCYSVLTLNWPVCFITKD
jgi:hypothetical protein